MLKNALQERVRSGDPILSIEFFPPKSDRATGQLLCTAERLKMFHPDFVSITYGAGGSTRKATLKYGKLLSQKYDYRVMPHLTCVGHSRVDLKEIVQHFKRAGLNQIMALRGDPPRGQSRFKACPDGLSHANELVQLIREEFESCTIGVAGYPETHPEALSAEADLLNLKRKVDAGAHFVTTQLFFDNNPYFDFVERARKADIEVPILPGLMSVTSLAQALRFCDMCGASMPETLKRKLAEAGEDPVAIETVSIDWVYGQALELLERNAPGIHLYILNRKEATIELMNRLQAVGFYKR